MEKSTTIFEPIHLTCEFCENALGIDVGHPSLSWIIDVNKTSRGFRQTAYHILVSTTLDKLNENEGDIWNSGKVESDQMGQIIYSGQPLESSHKYWWKVKIWNETGESSDWSEPAFWIMGVLQANDWVTSLGEKRIYPYDLLV